MTTPPRRFYEVVEPMETANVYIVRATSRDDAEQRVRANDHDAIVDSYLGDVFPSRRRWAVRWLRKWRE